MRKIILEAAGFLIALVACTATVIMVPEVRNFFGLPPDYREADQTPDQRASPPASIESYPQPTVAPITADPASAQTGAKEDPLGTRNKTDETPAASQERMLDKTATNGLVIFKVAPADASLYLNREFIGTPRDLSEGIWIQKGEHALAIVRPGYQSREGTLTVTGGSLKVEVELQRYQAATQPPVDPSMPAQALELPAGLSKEDLAEIQVVIRYRGSRENDALTIAQRLSSYGIRVATEQEIVDENQRWSRIYYPFCHEEVAREIRSLLPYLLRLPLIRSKADCNPTVDIVIFS